MIGAVAVAVVGVGLGLDWYKSVHFFFALLQHQLSQLLHVVGIPTLVLLDEAHNVISSAGCAYLAKDPDGNLFPWFGLCYSFIGIGASTTSRATAAT